MAGFLFYKFENELEALLNSKSLLNLCETAAC